MKILIPAREGSKGFPHKNRIFFNDILNSIPQNCWRDITVSTNDEYIINQCTSLKIDYIKRSEILSDDNASVKDVLLDYTEQRPSNDSIILLYLTYPTRSWKEIIKAYDFFKEHKGNSLLCKKEIKTNPYLCMFENGLNGKQIISHDLYRRQDYPKCFEISHYIGIFKPTEIINLNKNLYNEQTIFFPIKDVIDVDTREDLSKIKK